jgi:hypothetical protein
MNATFFMYTLSHLAPFLIVLVVNYILRLVNEVSVIYCIHLFRNFLNFLSFRMSIEYFQARLYFEDYEALKKTEGKAIIAFEPHDILPVAVVLFTEHFKLFRPLNIRGCFTSAIFMVPGMKHFFSWSGSTDANKSTIRRLISEGKTPALCPGGVQEVTYMTTPDAKEIYLHLRNRLGLIKIAAEYGLSVVPIFSFGQRKTYDYWVPQWPWLQKLGRKMGFLPILIQGYMGIPFAIPKQVPLTMVVGTPIPVRKMTKEEIEKNSEELHAINAQLIKAMEKLFEDYKSKFNMEDNILIIK